MEKEDELDKIDKDEDHQDDNSSINGDQETNKMKKASHVLFDTLIECNRYVQENHNPLNEQRKFRQIIFDTIKDKHKTEFIRWFGDHNNDSRGDNNNVLEPKFKLFIVECLNVCRGINKFKLQLFPTEFIKDDKEESMEQQNVNIEDEGDNIDDHDEYRFIIDDILNMSDIMERDDLFDSTPIDGKWYCSFPGIIVYDKDDNDHLNDKQIFKVINTRNTDKYDIFASKLWMFQAVSP